jgi:hypothetical protein
MTSRPGIEESQSNSGRVCYRQFACKEPFLRGDTRGPIREGAESKKRNVVGEGDMGVP